MPIKPPPEGYSRSKGHKWMVMPLPGVPRGVEVFDTYTEAWLYAEKVSYSCYILQCELFEGKLRKQ